MIANWFKFNKVSDQLEKLVQQALTQYQNELFPAGVLAVASNIEMTKKKANIIVTFTLPFPCQSEYQAIAEHVKQALAAANEQSLVELKINTKIIPVFMHSYDGIKNIIVISSGKGGVGKSTTTVNLAYALQAQGASVGILDADVYGPSLPKMLGLEGLHPRSPDGMHLEPIIKNGIAAMSTGFLADGQEAKIWRGAVASSAFEQMLKDTLWGGVDYLLIDMPPGTGDIQLTLAQKIEAVISVIVTTPQDIALIDATKGISMFEKINIPILGLIENMSYHICPKCQNKSTIFGDLGGEELAQAKAIPLLGQLPLDIKVREYADQGQSIQEQNPQADIAQIYRSLASKLTAELYYQKDSRSPHNQDS
ncbi:iron-sulfur cluster carrier protein ApbC [Colwelliaceae bacterium BS250]